MNKAEEMKELIQKYYDTFFDEKVYQMILSLIKTKASHGESSIMINTIEPEEKYYITLLKALKKEGFYTHFTAYYNNDRTITSYIYISWS